MLLQMALFHSSYGWGRFHCVCVYIYIHSTYTDTHTSSVQFSRSVLSDSFQPHESQHARPPCPSPTSRVHSDSHPLSQWCHPAVSSSVIPFSSCSQSLPALQSFPMSQLFPWGGQSTGASALASFLPKKSQGWSPSEWTMPKPLTLWITINCGKFWKRWEYQTTWPASWEICMQVSKQQLELDMEQQTGSK